MRGWETSGVWLTRNGRKYTGVDVSEEGVSLAQSIGLDARAIEDAASLPFDSATFDVVLCIEVLEHLFTPHLAAKECARVLRPGGILLATTPNVAYWRRRLDMVLFGRWHPDGDHLSVEQPWRDPHIRFFNPGALRQMCTTPASSPFVSADTRALYSAIFLESGAFPARAAFSVPSGRVDHSISVRKALTRHCE